MEFIHNISTVARYEAKTLRRSWFFRLFSLGSLFILSIANIAIFSPIGDEDWRMIAIPSTFPLVSLYLLNIGQSLVVIFLASDFLRRDKKLDTNEVLYTRSMSNLEYISGKTFGILRLFISFNLLILCIVLLMNIISRRASVDIGSYFEYLLIISVPTIVFSLGLAFMLMTLIRNQAITFLLLLGYAFLNIFYLWHRAGFLFDYMAFGLPVYKSGMIGFENISYISLQRMIYLFAGLSMVMLTVLLFKRLPQSVFQRYLTIILCVCFATVSAWAVFRTVSEFSSKGKMKSEIIAINRKFEKSDFPEMKKISIDLLHKGNSIEVNSSLVFSNNNKSELTQYLFSLNPSLEVSDVTSAGKALSFKTDGHIIEITPDRPLQPGYSDSLTISYSGSVSESFCYPGYSDNFRDFPYRTAMLNINKRQSFLTPGYLLLTPETHWYPVAGLNYYPSNPATIKVDFTKFRLSAVSENRLVAVSQGDMKKSGEKFIYEPATPLTGLTLAMGSYLKDSIKIDSVRYYTWYFKGNDYYKKDLAELKDTLKYLVSGIMRELESTFSIKYPFPTLSVVEVPVQFYSLPRQNTQTRAELQPSMVLVPEKLVTLDNAGFGKSFTRSKKRAARNNQVITDKEIQLRLFNNFIRQTFISGEDFRFENGRAINEPVRFRLGPSFYFFRNNFYSTEYPVLNAAFESHLQKVTIPDANQRFGGFFATVSEADLANLILRNLSFRELMERSPDVDTVRKVLAVKGDYLFSILRKFAGIEEFNKWFPAYLEKNKFKKINVLEFDDDIYTRFGFRLYGYLGDWFNGRQQPGFRFTNLQAKEMVVNERKRYLVTFIASNPESTGGLFTAAFRTGSETGGGQLNMGMINFRGQGTSVQISGQVRGVDAADLSRIVYLNPHESKQISIILDNTPRELIINTMFSLNLPGEIILPVNDITKSRQKPERVLEELTVQSPPEIRDINELIIDNEDSGFVNPKVSNLNPLKKMLGVRNEERELYGVINNFFAPEHWQPVIQTTYYGKYVLSAVYTRAGTGDKSVTWKGLITKAGYYDIYTHIGKSGSSVSITNASGPQGGQQQKGDNTYSDFHFRIFHDDGIEELSLDYQNAEPGWNKLGTYYLSGDTAKVTLTNKSQGRLVVGDAVKWVLQK